MVNGVEPGFEQGKLDSIMAGCTELTMQLPCMNYRCRGCQPEKVPVFPAILFESKADHLCSNVAERKNT